MALDPVHQGDVADEGIVIVREVGPDNVLRLKAKRIGAQPVIEVIVAACKRFDLGAVVLGQRPDIDAAAISAFAVGRLHARLWGA